jgi:hypothetical protein
MTADLSTLQALLARVEGGAGEDRELDLDIAVHVAGLPRNWQGFQLARYTTSLDAAVALAERRLPDWPWFLRRDDTDANGKRPAPVYNAALLFLEAPRVTPGTAQCTSPAHALVAAVLRAEIAKREAGND